MSAAQTSTKPTFDTLEVPAYPPEFIYALAENAGHTLDCWLRAHDAPQEIIDLTSELDLLYYYQQQTRGLSDMVPHGLNESILESVSIVTRAIAELGGRFHGPMSATRSRLDGVPDRERV